MTRRLIWTLAAWIAISIGMFLALPASPQDRPLSPPAPGDLLRTAPRGRPAQLPRLPADSEQRGGSLYDCATRTGGEHPDTYKVYYGGSGEDRTVYGLYDRTQDSEEARFGPPLLVVLFQPGTGTVTDVYVVTASGLIERYQGEEGLRRLRAKWPTPCDALVPHQLKPAGG